MSKIVLPCGCSLIGRPLRPDRICPAAARLRAELIRAIEADPDDADDAQQNFARHFEGRAARPALRLVSSHPAE